MRIRNLLASIGDVIVLATLLAAMIWIAWAAPVHARPMARCWLYDSGGKLITVSASPIVAGPGQFVVILDAEKKPTAAQIDSAKASMIKRSAVKPAAIKPAVNTDSQLVELDKRIKALELKAIPK